MQGSLSITAAVNDHIYSQNFADAGGGKEKHEISLPAGKAGNAAWGGSSAVITLGAGHGLTTANVVAVKWATGRRIAMTISAYDSTTITVTNSSGRGDALPTSGTADVVVGPRVVCADISFDGDNARFLLVTADQYASIDFYDSTPMNLYYVSVQADSGYYWSYSTGVSPPITGNPVASAEAYNHTITPATLKVSVVLVS
jgi:hypothetical protein